MTDATRQLPLHTRHAALGARFAPFAGYQMPMRYGSIVAEHEAVRGHVGLFDVSHMGEIELRGKNAGATLDTIVTNDVSMLADGEALYTVMCHEDGGIVDDLLVYRLAADHYLCCVNAANRHKDVDHVRTVAAAFTAARQLDPSDCQVVDRSDDYVQLAVQGPAAASLLDPLVDVEIETLAGFEATEAKLTGRTVLVSRTGYTGEDGFELYYATGDAEPIFDTIWEAGRPEGLLPIGLAARDTLRLEARLMLYGNDITDQTTPLEAGLAWTVKLDKGDFIGREALVAQKRAGPSRRLRGFVLEGRGVLRAGCDIFIDGEHVGRTTSGGPSPTLGGSIALGYVDIEHTGAERAEIDVRGRKLPCRVTRKPFYRRSNP